MVLNHIVAKHYAKHRLIVADRTYYANEILRQSLANLEYQVLSCCWLHRQYGSNNIYAINNLGVGYELLLSALNSLSLELLNILLQSVVLINIFSDNAFKILSVVEQALQSHDSVLQSVDSLFACLTCKSLDTADAGSYATLRDNLEETNLTCALSVDTTTELSRRTEANNTNLVAILLAKEGDSAKFLSFFDRSIAMLVEWIVGTNHLVDHTLYLAKFLVCYLLEVREVETQSVLVYIRTLLLYVLAQNLLQAIVEQVGCCMVSCATLTRVDIYTSHEVG